MFFVILSIGVFVLETHELFRDPNPGAILGNSSITATCSSYDCRCRYSAPVLTINNSEPKAYMTYLDYVCAAFFSFEYLMRIFFAPRKLNFLKQPLNIIDLLCLVPHFVIIIVQMVDPQNATSDYFKPILALRIIRVMRIFKLMKHYGAFKIFAYTIKVSTKELLLMVVFLFTGVLIFASVMYYVENETFHSIPIGFWWALVTMTTVGYGDKVPKSEGGFIIGSMCVLCGVLTVAFTVPIVVNNFTLYYSHAQSRIKLPIDKRKELKKKLVMKNQKNALEYVKKMTLSAQEFSQLESIKSPRDDTQSIKHSKFERNSDLISEMNISMCDSIPERKTPTPGQNRVSPISNTSEGKISTISETMIEDIQITDPCAPLTPSVPLNKKVTYTIIAVHSLIIILSY